MTEFTADPTSSNKTGVTLMDNQVGHVVADVMRGKENVTVTVLPSMIRVDGVGKVGFDYRELADALGWTDFGNDDFEEIMSTHYGRMVVLDDRILFFANPEDAAEYLGFDLQEVAEPCTSQRREVLHAGHHTHFWDASPENWVKGQEQYAEGWSTASTPIRASGQQTHWPIEKFQKYSEDDFVKDMFEDGYVESPSSSRPT